MHPLSKHDGVIYVTLENGKTYRLEHLLEHCRHIRAVDEIRDETTRRREWWRRHVVSRDVPDSKAARADYCDNGRSVSHMVDAIDGRFKSAGSGIVMPTEWGVQFGNKWYYRCVIGKANCQRIAHKMMMLHWWRIAKFVVSVWRYGSKERFKTMADFEICEKTYYLRLSRYAEILGFGSGVDMC